MILVADIGGTKTRFALASGTVLHASRRYENDAYPNFDALLKDYFAQTPLSSDKIEAACLAFAGPVTAGRARLTNRAHWQLAEDDLRRSLRVPTRLVNDFAAAAAGLPSLGEDEVETLQAGINADGLRLCLGPGTGLGVAALLGEQLVESEGGHIGFAPMNGQQSDFWRFLGGEHRRITAERICSGPGLVACYRYCCVRSGHPLPPDIEPADIVTRADKQHDPDAQHAMILFATIFGSIAGDLALAFMARGGVYLAGGIPRKILPYLTSGDFLSAFNDKAEHAKLVQRFPVYLVRGDDLELRGAARLGRQLVGHRD